MPPTVAVGLASEDECGPSRWRLIAVPLALFGLAFVVRWPHFATVPAPTDETDELLWAWKVAQGAFRPLTASDPYIGPACTYLTALAFGLAGPSFETGRSVAVLLGALAAPATWLLGRWLVGAMAGLVAGLLVAVAFGPVVMSHVAWSHGSAPAALALGLALLARGSSLGSKDRSASGESSSRAAGVILAASGFWLALAVAAHPTVVCLLPGVIVWWGWQHRQVPRLAARRMGCLLGGGLVGYAPGLWFLATEGAAPFWASVADREYVARTAGGYAEGVWLWLASLARNLAGPATHQLTDGRLWLTGALLALALASPWLARRRAGHGSGRGQPAPGGSWLPLAVIVSGALGMPCLLDGERFTSFTGLRYAAPALPAAAVAVGGLMAGLSTRMRLAVVVGTLAVAVATTASFYRATLAHGVSGVYVLEVVDGIVAQWQAPAIRDRTPVLVESGLDVKLAGGGEVGRALKVLLELRGVPVQKARVDKIRWFAVHDRSGSLHLVLSANGVAALDHDVLLVPHRVVEVVPGQVSRSGPSWGWYGARARLWP